MNKKQKYLVITFVPLFILLAMAVPPLRAMFWGQEILLETIPLDPRDIFRGDHVVLNYKISQVEEEKVPPELKNEEYEYYRKNLYAVLKPAGEFYEVEYISIKKPDRGIFLKCRFEYREQPQQFEASVYHFSYYLDRYFVPENTGEELEQLSREGKLRAAVKVLGDYALLTGISL